MSSGVSDQGVRTFSTAPAPVDTLLPLAIGSYLTDQFSSIWDQPAVFHIARIVPQSVVEESDGLTSAYIVLKAEAVAQL